MLKRLLMVVAFMLMSVNTSAANWAKTYTGLDKDIFVDLDSIEYNQIMDIVKSWNKVISKKGDDVYYLVYDYFDLKNRKVAKEYTVVYTGDKSDSESESYLKYKPVIPDTIMENLYKSNEFFAELIKRGIEFTPCNMEIPDPSHFGDENWESDHEGIYLDKASKKMVGTRVYAWFMKVKENDETYKYICIDGKTGKMALLKEFGMKNQKFYIYEAPVIFFTEAKDIMLEEKAKKAFCIYEN